MICVLRNALGRLGDLAVRAVPAKSVPPVGSYRLIDPLVEFAGAVIDDDVAPAVSADAEHGPAGVRVPPSTPPAGHPELDVPLVIELLEPYDLKAFAEHLRTYAAAELLDRRFARRLADLLSADPTP